MRHAVNPPGDPAAAPGSASLPHPAPITPPPLHTWQDRLDHIVETMREMSLQTDPQAMVEAYGSRMRSLIAVDRTISLSRRDLDRPLFRITRDSDWLEDINPWKQRARLPLLSGGLFADWIYGNRPIQIDDLAVPRGDPAFPYLTGYRSALVVPHYDRGESLNMVVHLRRGPQPFDPEDFPALVQMSNLFGRATHNLVLSSQLKEAYEALDHELAVVAQIQRSLLPAELPVIPGLELSAHYQTSKRAGGDYYDLFPLPDGKWGILIADVSGHGTPAAVVMAIMHSIAHAYPGPATPPQAMMNYLNRTLSQRYTNQSGTFVTAFYGIYDPRSRELTYSSAGHNPPRFIRLRQGECDIASASDAVAASIAGSGSHPGELDIFGLDAARNLPLGIDEHEHYTAHTERLGAGDAVVLYTDGVTEAWNDAGDMFGVQRLDEALAAARGGRLDAAIGLGDLPPAKLLLRMILNELSRFTAGRPADDDRTLVSLVGV
ncbi:MAG: PP2C family protein-serine/threonine phosphatase [Phycisphaerales bacterium]